MWSSSFWLRNLNRQVEGSFWLLLLWSRSFRADLWKMRSSTWLAKRNLFWEQQVRQIWSLLNWVEWLIPPEIFFSWEIGASLKCDSCHHIVIQFSTFDSSPKLKQFILILMTKFQYTSLKSNNFFGWQGLSDSVDKPEFWAEIVNVHYYLSVV